MTTTKSDETTALLSFRRYLDGGDLERAGSELRVQLARATGGERLVRCALAGAELARRRGTPRDARTWVRDARRALDAMEPDARRSLEPEVVLAEATQAIEQGADAAADRMLMAGLDMVRSPPGAFAARFHSLLGALAARRGRPGAAASHYRLALDLLDPHTESDSVARLQSNLAMSFYMRGVWDEASRWIDAALTDRSRPGAPLGPLANSLAVRALIEAARGSGADAWDLPLDRAAASGDAVLWCEIALQRAMVARRQGDHGLADSLEDKAAVRMAEAGRQEPTLVAMAAEARARRLHAHGSLEPAIVALGEASALFEELGSAWHHLRLQLSLGAWESGVGRTATAVERIGRTCRRAASLGVVFPAEPEVRDAVLLSATHGQAAAATWARARGWDTPSVGAGASLFPEVGVVQLDGERFHLGPRTLPFRLLLLLSEAKPAGLTTTHLCRRLWRGERPGTAALGRLRVLVTRTRELTEPGHILILTVRQDGAGAAGRYRWNPDVPVRVLEGTPTSR